MKLNGSRSGKQPHPRRNGATRESNLADTSAKRRPVGRSLRANGGGATSFWSDGRAVMLAVLLMLRNNLIA